MRQAVLFLSFVACVTVPTRDTPEPVPVISASCEGTDADLSFLTFNTALAPGINPWASERAPIILDALSRVEDDVICLQEVWTESDRSTIRRSLESRGYHVVAPDTRGEQFNPWDMCTHGELRLLHACVDNRCGGIPDEHASICAMERCTAELVVLYMVSRQCFNCVASQVGKSADKVEAVCAGGPGGSRVYDGGNAVMFASRLPLEMVEMLRFPSSGANRVALLARAVEPHSGMRMEIACTHLSAPNKILPPPHPDFSTWEEEQLAQWSLMVARLRERAANRPIVIIGDMNFGGPRPPYVQSFSGPVWYRAARDGFDSPAARASPPLCTSCGTRNTLMRAKGNFLIDHVLVFHPLQARLRLAPACATAVFRSPVQFWSHGRFVWSNRSDHFGMRVKFIAEEIH